MTPSGFGFDCRSSVQSSLNSGLFLVEYGRMTTIAVVRQSCLLAVSAFITGKGLDTCYSATYISQTRDQQRFTISEVATDWCEPVVPQRIMWPSIARANGQ